MNNNIQQREDELREVKLYQSNNWDISEETETFFILKRNTASLLGHILVFLLTFWFTMGIGNIVYWFAKRETKKIIK